MNRLRFWISLHLVTWAGRLHPDSDFRCASTLTLTLERGRGWVLHKEDQLGLPVWFRQSQYHLAHDEAADLV